MHVRSGRVWNKKKWRDDIDGSSRSTPKIRVPGHIIGYTNDEGILVGRNSGREYDTDRITRANGPGWAVVEWETGKSSVYPIGYNGVHALVSKKVSGGRTVGAKATS